jgi:hypothetical protein
MAAKSSFSFALNQSSRLREQRGTVDFPVSMMALLRDLTFSASLQVVYRPLLGT